MMYTPVHVEFIAELAANMVDQTGSSLKYGPETPWLEVQRWLDTQRWLGAINLIIHIIYEGHRYGLFAKERKTARPRLCPPVCDTPS